MAGGEDALRHGWWRPLPGKMASGGPFEPGFGAWLLWKPVKFAGLKLPLDLGNVVICQTKNVSLFLHYFLMYSDPGNGWSVLSILSSPTHKPNMD